MVGKEDLDSRFVEILEEKVSKYKHSEPTMYREFFSIETLLGAGKYLDDLRPKSKYRDFKHQILEFIDILDKEHNFSKKEIVSLKQEYLSGLVIYLLSDHSFAQKHGWFWRGVFNLGLDITLIIIGIAKYYYSIPIFTILSVTRNVLKLKKAKKEGKYIDF